MPPNTCLLFFGFFPFSLLVALSFIIIFISVSASVCK